ncbi:MAG TPA: hypothetical protein VFW33_11015, partial [Gemmataceae bacterium]|nr:hypothetical protein [Gemmataceae bacterium]
MVSGVGFDLSGLYVPPIGAGEFPGRPPGGEREWVDGNFVCGPIPLSWLGRLCRLDGGKVVATGLAVWFQVGLRKSKEGVKLTSKGLERFGVSRQAKKDALKA